MQTTFSLPTHISQLPAIFLPKASNQLGTELHMFFCVDRWQAKTALPPNRALPASLIPASSFTHHTQQGEVGVGSI